MTNQRQWRDFLTALQDTVSDHCAAYPKIVDALRAGRERFINELVNPRWMSASAAADTNTHYNESRAETLPALVPMLQRD